MLKIFLCFLSKDLSYLKREYTHTYLKEKVLSEKQNKKKKKNFYLMKC